MKIVFSIVIILFAVAALLNFADRRHSELDDKYYYDEWWRK